jgi:hypothetical protein
VKIKCVHLLSNPNDKREMQSKMWLRCLPHYDIPSLEIVNAPWAGEVPPARLCQQRPFTLTKGMYGCWKAHKDAITNHLVDCDFLLVCECDCIPTEAMRHFAARVHFAASACLEGNLDVFTLGYKHGGKTIDAVGSQVIVITQWIETHCYLVPMKSRQLFLEMFEKPWDQIDYAFTIYLYDQQKRRIGAFADRPAAIQADGVSLTDGSLRANEKQFMNVRHDS